LGWFWLKKRRSEALNSMPVRSSGNLSRPRRRDEEGPGPPQSTFKKVSR
jgi:hypothetical protein